MVVVRNEIGPITVEAGFARRLHQRVGARFAGFCFLLGEGHLCSVEDDNGISTHTLTPNDLPQPQPLESQGSTKPTSGESPSTTENGRGSGRWLKGAGFVDGATD